MIDASGRDTRGQGNAKATIVVTMHDDGDGTKVDVVTDLSITGKVAEFGRGVLVDVSSKLMGQFVENLERDVLASDAGGGDRSHRGRRRASRAGSRRAARCRRPAARRRDGGPRRIDRRRPSPSTCSTWRATPRPSAWCRSGSASLVLFVVLAAARRRPDVLAASARTARRARSIELVFDPARSGARASTPASRAAATASSPVNAAGSERARLRRDPHAARAIRCPTGCWRSTTSSRRSSPRCGRRRVAVERVLFQATPAPRCRSGRRAGSRSSSRRAPASRSRSTARTR